MRRFPAARPAPRKHGLARSCAAAAPRRSPPPSRSSRPTARASSTRRGPRAPASRPRWSTRSPSPVSSLGCVGTPRSRAPLVSTSTRGARREYRAARRRVVADAQSLADDGHGMNSISASRSTGCARISCLAIAEAGVRWRKPARRRADRASSMPKCRRLAAIAGTPDVQSRDRRNRPVPISAHLPRTAGLFSANSNVHSGDSMRGEKTRPCECPWSASGTFRTCRDV